MFFVNNGSTTKQMQHPLETRESQTKRNHTTNPAAALSFDGQYTERTMVPSNDETNPRVYVASVVSVAWFNYECERARPICAHLAVRVTRLSLSLLVVSKQQEQPASPAVSEEVRSFRARLSTSSRSQAQCSPRNISIIISVFLLVSTRKVYNKVHLLHTHKHKRWSPDEYD